MTLQQALRENMGYLVRFGCLVHCVQNYLFEVTTVGHCNLNLSLSSHIEKCIGPSMLPTLDSSGNLVLVEKISQKFHDLKPGDVIVAQSPTKPKQTVCKRIIGQAGDVIRIKPKYNMAITREIKIPKGHVWLEGDNSENSTDSRHYGPVPYALVKGKVLLKDYELLKKENITDEELFLKLKESIVKIQSGKILIDCTSPPHLQDDISNPCPLNSSSSKEWDQVVGPDQQPLSPLPNLLQNQQGLNQDIDQVGCSSSTVVDNTGIDGNISNKEKTTTTSMDKITMDGKADTTVQAPIQMEKEKEEVKFNPMEDLDHPKWTTHYVNTVGLGKIEGKFSTLWDYRAEEFTIPFIIEQLQLPLRSKELLNYLSDDCSGGLEIVLFWLEVQAYRALPSAKYAERRLIKIYDKYLSASSSMQVCIPKKVLEPIEKAIKLGNGNITAGTFWDAQSRCYNDIERCVFPRFVASQQYAKMRSISQGDSNFSLGDIVNDPVKYKYLKQFCMESHTLEGLLFYFEVEDCKRLPNASYTSNQARKIYDKFIKENGKFYIPFEQENSVFIQEKLTNGDLSPDMFNYMQGLAMQCIQLEIWPKFWQDKGFPQTFTEDEVEECKKPNIHNMTKRGSTRRVLTTEWKGNPDDHKSSNGVVHRRRSVPSIIVTPPGEISHFEPVMAILYNTLGRKFLNNFMLQDRNEHYLSFWVEVELYKTLPGIGFMKLMARKIYHKYVSIDAKLQVDMSAEMREELLARLDNPSPDMYKRVYHKVLKGILQDILPRFLQSTSCSLEGEPSPRLGDNKKVNEQGKLDMEYLENLLADDSTSLQLFQFMKDEHSSENYLIAQAIENFRRLPASQLTNRSAKKIYDKFLSLDNDKPRIELAPSILDSIASRINDPDRRIFDVPERLCLEYIRDNVIPVFLESDAFTELAEKWLSDPTQNRLLKGELELAYVKNQYKNRKVVKRN